jgi:hypothetical protein
VVLQSVLGLMEEVVVFLEAQILNLVEALVAVAG